MKVWIVKYALTQGIIEKEVRGCKNDMVADDTSYITAHYHKEDYCLDKQSALAKAEQMRQKKIASLKKQIEKLEKMKFE